MSFNYPLASHNINDTNRFDTVGYGVSNYGGYYHEHPYWCNPPVYIQPSYVPVWPTPVIVAAPPVTYINFPVDDGLKEEVAGLKDEIKKLRKQLAKGKVNG